MSERSEDETDGYGIKRSGVVVENGMGLLEA